MNVRLVLVRHAQSGWQLTPSEDDDSPLTPVGHEQASHLAEWLAGQPALDCERHVKISSIVTSPLIRARQTAEYLANALCLPVTTEESLREADFYVAGQLPVAPGPLARPIGDSAVYAQFKRQALRAFTSLVRQGESGPVLAVSHGGLIKTMLRLAAGTDGFCFRLYNTGISILEWRAGRWHLDQLNLLDHLDPSQRTH